MRKGESYLEVQPSKRDVFEETVEHLKDDLSRAQIAHDKAEAREQEAKVDCQRALKVFKFKKYNKKYKEGYKDEKRGAPPKYSLDIGSSLKGGSRAPLGGGATHAAELEAPQDPPCKDATSLTSAPVSIASDAERVVDVSFAMVVESSPNALSVDVALPAAILRPVAPEARQVTQDAVDKVAIPATTSEASQEGKSQVSD